MSCFVMPARSSAAAVTGISISTSLASVTARTWSDCANETIATSRIPLAIGQRPPALPARLVHLGVGLAVGAEVAEALERRPDLVVVDPHGLDAHADGDVVDVHLLQEVHQGEVSPVEEDQAARVRHLHGLAVELHVHDAERGER